MSRSTHLSVSLHLGALFLLFQLAPAQQEPPTPAQVIRRYMDAVGADRLSSITSFVEIGDLYGNLTNFWSGYSSPRQALDQKHGTFESYFKRPNLRFNSSLTGNNSVIALDGCDGKKAWYIDSYSNLTELKPRPGNASECDEGFETVPSHLQAANVKMRLVKKKEIEGRMAWEVKVDVPKSQSAETYYFDAETFLLLRFERLGDRVTYSDYRDLGGIKFPFTAVREFTNSKLITTVREIKINAPIDDAQFTEPLVKHRVISMNPVASATKKGTEVSNDSSPTKSATNAAISDTSSVSPPHSPAQPNPASIVEVNFPNFASCTIEEILRTVPELEGLKPAADQGKLAALLDRVGDKTLDIARNTPNLISRESVTESQQGARETRRDYDYLILARVEGKVVDLDEFRVDLKSGDKFQTDELMKKDSSTRAELERASHELSTSQAGRPPISQGFATSWVHFYPLNRPRAIFRYLGEQRLGGQRRLVLAFAQKPASVLFPAIIQYQGKTVPMYLQGVAWVDPSNFQILRLRTDLLSPLPEVSLHRLTADIQFGSTRIENVASPLQLPREVTVTLTLGGSTTREIHKYSEYRLFRAQSRIVLNP